MSLTGIGAIAGVPLALAGGAVGGAGGLVVGGGILGEIIAKNMELKDANAHLQSDYFHSMQIRILIGRAAHDEAFADRLNISAKDALGFVSIAGRTAKVTVATANFVKSLATGVARGAGTAGLHIAGIAISAVLIPLDLYQMITSAIKVHTKEKAEVAKKLEEIAQDLRTGLSSILKSEKYELVELERQDDQKKHHAFLLAVDGSEINTEQKFNPSIEEIERDFVVVMRNEGDKLDSEQYQEIIDLWMKDFDDNEKLIESDAESSECSEIASNSDDEDESLMTVNLQQQLGINDINDNDDNNYAENDEEFPIVREEDGVIELQQNSRFQDRD